MTDAEQAAEKRIEESRQALKPLAIGIMAALLHGTQDSGQETVSASVSRAKEIYEAINEKR